MSDYDGRKPEPPYATDTDELEQEIKDLQEQLEQKDKESKKLQKKIHNQRVALRENWEITESRRKPWALKTMAKWHVENKELKARNRRLEAENEINNGKIRGLAKVVDDLSDSMAYIANHVNLEMFYGRAIDDIEKAREALNQLEKPRE